MPLTHDIGVRIPYPLPKPLKPQRFFLLYTIQHAANLGSSVKVSGESKLSTKRQCYPSSEAPLSSHQAKRYPSTLFTLSTPSSDAIPSPPCLLQIVWFIISKAQPCHKPLPCQGQGFGVECKHNRLIAASSRRRRVRLCVNKKKPNPYWIRLEEAATYSPT